MTNLEVFRGLKDRPRAALFVHCETSIIDYQTYYYTLDNGVFTDYGRALEHSLYCLAGLPEPVTEAPADTVAKLLMKASRYCDGIIPVYQLPDNSEVRSEKKAIDKTILFLFAEHDPEAANWW